MADSGPTWSKPLATPSSEVRTKTTRPNVVARPVVPTRTLARRVAATPNGQRLAAPLARPSLVRSSQACVVCGRPAGTDPLKVELANGRLTVAMCRTCGDVGYKAFDFLAAIQGFLKRRAKR